MKSAAEIHQSIINNHDIFKQLKLFASNADGFNANSSECDFVQEYLSVSGDCKEILKLLKSVSEEDVNNVEVLYEVLYHILLRIASDLDAYNSLGHSISNEILHHGIKTLFAFIEVGRKSSTTKLALNVLCAMTALGQKTACAVYSNVDLQDPMFTSLLDKINVEDEVNFRTLLINLVVLFLQTCEDYVIRQILELKGFLKQLFVGLVNDRSSTITLVLNAFVQYVLKSSSIAKSTKMNVFNNEMLLPVIPLYYWRGPQGKTSLKRKFNAEAPPAVEASKEEIEAVRTAVHDFMLLLCTSNEYGVCQHLSLDITKKNQDITITSILLSLSQPFANSLMSDFVVAVLKTLPIQMRHFLPKLKSSISPRPSVSWFQAIEFLRKIITSQDVIFHLFKDKQKKSLPVLTANAKLLCFPHILIEQLNMETFFQTKPLNMCHSVVQLFIGILKQVKAVIDFCNSGSDSQVTYTTSDLNAFKNSFVDAAFHQNFRIVNLVHKYFEKLTFQQEKDEAKCAEGIPQVGIYKQLQSVAVLLKLHQTLFQQCEGSDINFMQMFDGLKNYRQFLPNKEFLLISLSLHEAAMAKDAAVLNNQEIVESLLTTAMETCVSPDCSHELTEMSSLIHKILTFSKIFDRCSWEIDIWVYALESVRKKHLPFVIKFLNSTLCMVMQVPNKFLDEILEHSFNSCASSKQQAMDISQDEEIGDEGSENLIDKVQTSHQQLCFSPMVNASLFNLNSSDVLARKDCHRFVETALMQIVYHQCSPKIFMSTIKKFKSVINEDNYNYWKLLASSKVADEMKSSRYVPEESGMLTWQNVSDHLQAIFSTVHASENPDDVQIALKSLKKFSLPQDWSLEDVHFMSAIAWQILAYLSFEANFITDKGLACKTLCKFAYLLNELVDCYCSKASEDPVSASKIHNIILSHPVTVKLFLDTEILYDTDDTKLKKSVKVITELALKSTKEISIANKKNLLIPFKEKALQYVTFTANNIRATKHLCGFKLLDVIEPFDGLWSSSEIICLLEQLLLLEGTVTSLGDTVHESFDSRAAFIISSVLFLLKSHVQDQDYVLLSPDTVKSLFRKYGEMFKNDRDLFRESIIELFRRHAIYTNSIDEGSVLTLLHQFTEAELLGMFIDGSKHHFKTIQKALPDIIASNHSESVMCLASKCLTSIHFNLEDTVDTDFMQSVSSPLWKSFMHIILDDESSDVSRLQECNIGEAIVLLLTQQQLSSSKVKKLFKRLQSASLSISRINLLLNLITVWKSHLFEDEETQKLVLQLVLQWMVSSMSDIQNMEISVLKNVVQACISLLEDATEGIINEVINPKEQYIAIVQKLLKAALKYENIGSNLLHFLSLLFAKGNKGGDMPVQTVHDLFTGHSKFLDILLNEKSELKFIKGSIIDVLIILAKLDKSVCKDKHIPLLLASYNATLDPIDQKLLYLLKLYENSGLLLTQFSPFPWGKSALGYYSMKADLSMRVLKETKVEDVLTLLVPHKIRNTVLKYPMELPLEPSLDNIDKFAIKNISPSEVYDLRFLLPMLYNLLSPGTYIQFNKFIESKCLALLFASLSSYNSATRAVGYNCLALLYNHLESTTYWLKGIWLALLDILRNSIVEPNTRIPSIITVFLSKVNDIFQNPNHVLFTDIYLYIMTKPDLNRRNVPAFFRLFNSSGVKSEEFRLWIMNLIHEGLRTSTDFHLCLKDSVFEVLFSYFWCESSKPEEKAKIMQILSSAVKTKSSAKILCQNGLLLWLHNVVEQKCSMDIGTLKGISSVMIYLWTHCQKEVEQHSEDNMKSEETSCGGASDKFIYASFPLQFYLVYVKLLKILSYLDIHAAIAYLQTFLEVIAFLKSDSHQSGFKLSAQDVELVYAQWEDVHKKLMNYTQNCSSVNPKTIQHLKHCHILCAKIATHWTPTFSESNQNNNYHLHIFLNVMNLALQVADNKSFFACELPSWLLQCIKSDKKIGLYKLLSRDMTCLKLFLGQFEKSLLHKRHICTPVDKKSSKNESLNSHWFDIVKYFKKLNKLREDSDANVFHLIQNFNEFMNFCY